MAAGVAGGLQNRFGAHEVSRVGSIPTRSRHIWGGLLLLVLALPAPAVAQEPVSSDSVGTVAAGDSVRTRPVGPMGAFFRSLLIPGWGQVAVDQPTRGAFYFAMEATSLWMLIKTQAKLDAAKRANPPNEALVSARTEQLEDWIVLSVFWALFSGVDAWVSAHLWGFETEVVPPPDGSVGAAIQYRIPVRAF